MKLRPAVLAIGAAIITTILATGSPAYAGTDASVSVFGSSAKFISYGDSIKVCDTSADGFYAYAVYSYYNTAGDPVTAEHVITTGNGTCYTWRHNWPEGTSVSIQACVMIPIYWDPCSPWKVGIA